VAKKVLGNPRDRKKKEDLTDDPAVDRPAKTKLRKVSRRGDSASQIIVACIQ